MSKVSKQSGKEKFKTNVATLTEEIISNLETELHINVTPAEKKFLKDFSVHEARAIQDTISQNLNSFSELDIVNYLITQDIYLMQIVLNKGDSSFQQSFVRAIQLMQKTHKFYASGYKVIIKDICNKTGITVAKDNDNQKEQDEVDVAGDHHDDLDG